MAAYNERPAIMPISNPTRLCEAKASDVIAWSEGRALVVTGSPSDPIAYNGVDYKIGQANNALLYPGLGFGIVIAKAKTVTDRMLSAAAHGITSVGVLASRNHAGVPQPPQSASGVDGEGLGAAPSTVRVYAVDGHACANHRLAVATLTTAKACADGE